MNKVIWAFIWALFAGVCFYGLGASAQMGPGMMGSGYGTGHGMMGWGRGMGWPGSILMLAFWILVIVGLVFLVKWLIQNTRAGGRVTHGNSRAIEIIKERYARGEIDKAEFEAKKRDLTG